MASTRFPSDYNLLPDGRRVWLVQANKESAKSGWHWETDLPEAAFSKRPLQGGWGDSSWIRSPASRSRIATEVKPDDVVVCYQADPGPAGDDGQSIIGLAHVSKGGYRRRGDTLKATFDMDFAVRVPAVPWSSIRQDSILRRSEKVTVKVGTVFRLSAGELYRLIDLMPGSAKQKSHLLSTFGLAQVAAETTDSLTPRLCAQLEAEGWSDFESWSGGIRGRRDAWRTIFGILEATSPGHEQIREAVLGLLERRAELQCADPLCLVTTAQLEAASISLLRSAGIDWRVLAPPLAEPQRPRAGLGKESGRPTGRHVPLPRGVTVRGSIRGSSGKKADRVVGSGAGYVDIDIPLRSARDGGPILLPPGFVMIAKSATTQHGLLVQAVRFHVPPDEDVLIRLQMYCANQGRSSATPEDTFDFGPAIDDADLLDLFRLLADRRISVDETRLVQESVWAITDGDGLTAENRAALEALPMRSQGGEG